MEINPVEVSWEGASRISGHSTFHSFARFLNPIDQLIRVESILLFVKISLFGRQVGVPFPLPAFTHCGSFVQIRNEIKLQQYGSFYTISTVCVFHYLSCIR